MGDERIDEHFVEVVSSVSHANGVFRIVLGQQAEAGGAKSVTRLLIPANQLQSVLRGIADGANEIREKLQQQAKEGDGAKGGEKPAGRKPSSKK